MIQSFKKEIYSHRFLYLLLVIILLGASFVRIYRTGVILGFYFDQGRDAMAVWNLIHDHNFFLIGPTTGIAGIFRGPFYYYLITPIYLISGGDPVWAANFLSLTTVVAICLMYYLGMKAHSRVAGLLASFIGAFSFNIMLSSRWLSNPTPMLLISMLLVLFIFLAIDGKKWAWVAVSLIAGVALFHFGSSGELFYFPALILIFMSNKKSWVDRKIVFLAFFAFALTASPLILFDLRNNHLLSNNIKSFILEKESFKSSFWEVLKERLSFYDGVFFGKIYPSKDKLARFLIVFMSFSFLYFLPKLAKNKKFTALVMLLLSPIVGLLFFQGNEGNIYDYYMTGYYFIFILTVGIFMAELWKNALGKILIIVFIYSFMIINLPIIFSKIRDNVDGPTTIAFKNQKKAIEWIYSDASGETFNVDVYVPPVIPHAYDYLFAWYPTTKQMAKYTAKETKTQVSLLYTLYEQDPPHPERLEEWMMRQKGIGEVIYEESFAGITVQRRKRI